MKYTKIYSSQEELDNDLANLHLDSVCFIDGGGGTNVESKVEYHNINEITWKGDGVDDGINIRWENADGTLEYKYYQKGEEIKHDKVIVGANTLFNDIRNITELDITRLDTSKCKSFFNMFTYMPKVKRIKGIESMNVGYATNMKRIFMILFDYEGSLDLHLWNTSNASNLYEMVNGFEPTKEYEDFKKQGVRCENLKYINIDNFDFSKCKDTHYFIDKIEGVEVISAQNVKTSPQTNFNGSFEKLTNLKQIILTNSDQHFKDEIKKALRQQNLSPIIIE